MMSETKNDTEARAKREIRAEYGNQPKIMLDALERERVKNLELRERVARLEQAPKVGTPAALTEQRERGGGSAKEWLKANRKQFVHGRERYSWTAGESYREELLDEAEMLEAYASSRLAQQPQISIEVYQQDWGPGYACFLDDGSVRTDAKAHVALNLASFLGSIEIGEIVPKDLPYAIAESLMHEIVHVLESWANVEFDEDRIEALLTAYREKYHPHAPRYEKCEPRETPQQQAFQIEGKGRSGISVLDTDVTSGVSPQDQTTTGEQCDHQSNSSQRFGGKPQTVNDGDEPTRLSPQNLEAENATLRAEVERLTKRWKPITEQVSERVLVTNNLAARDAYGKMSHVWIGFVLAADDSEREGKWVTYGDDDRKIINLTHYCQIPQGKD